MEARHAKAAGLPLITRQAGNRVASGLIGIGYFSPISRKLLSLAADGLCKCVDYEEIGFH